MVLVAPSVASNSGRVYTVNGVERDTSLDEGIRGTPPGSGVGERSEPDLSRQSYKQQEIVVRLLRVRRV
jgi:hypothetical protein